MGEALIPIRTSLRPMPRKAGWETAVYFRRPRLMERRIQRNLFPNPLGGAWHPAPPGCTATTAYAEVRLREANDVHR